MCVLNHCLSLTHAVQNHLPQEPLVPASELPIMATEVLYTYRLLLSEIDQSDCEFRGNYS